MIIYHYIRLFWEIVYFCGNKEYLSPHQLSVTKFNFIKYDFFCKNQCDALTWKFKLEGIKEHSVPVRS